MLCKPSLVGFSGLFHVRELLTGSPAQHVEFQNDRPSDVFAASSPQILLQHLWVRGLGEPPGGSLQSGERSFSFQTSLFCQFSAPAGKVLPTLYVLQNVKFP